MSSEDYTQFFVGQGKNPSPEAVAACASCPVKEQCLDHALKYEKYGYWAGKSSIDRKKMRKELGIELIDIAYESSVQQMLDALKIEQAIQDQKIKGRGRKKKQKENSCESDW